MFLFHCRAIDFHSLVDNSCDDGSIRKIGTSSSWEGGGIVVSVWILSSSLRRGVLVLRCSCALFADDDALSRLANVVWSKVCFDSLPDNTTTPTKTRNLTKIKS